jgi:hypothetical protein
MPNQPFIAAIQKRFSCRTYQNRPIAAEHQQALDDVLARCQAGPLGSTARFMLVAAAEDDARALRGLGTYGLIRGATGYIIGAVADAEHDLEDFGYLAEEIVLRATDLGLGTCWLGGTFRRSRFADRMALRDDEQMVAVIATGYPADRRSLVDQLVRRGAGASQRLPWERLFFEGGFDAPLSREAAGVYALPLLMVRRGPSASNRQPWRIVHDGRNWHFYLQRTPGYRRQGSTLFATSDLQRVDMGIAMCHFALSAGELGLAGEWIVADPGLVPADELAEYCVTYTA